MKILYINDAWAIWGGLERVLIEKMNYLADDECYEIFTFTFNQGTHPLSYPLGPKVIHRDLNVQLHHQYRYHGFKKYYYKYKLQYLLIKRLRSGIKEVLPDIIVCPRIELLDYIFKVKGSIPLIYECHSSCKWIASEKDSLLWRIKRYYLKRQTKKVQMVVSLTEGDATEWRKFSNHVCVIPNVVHLNEGDTYSDCAAKSVIFVGRFSKQKDVGSLLAIWALVHRRHPDWSLHVYGGYGEVKDKFLTEIKQMDANIQVHEPTSDIIEKYKENSILLMTSFYEPFGLVLPEAMSCGLPVISFDCPYGPLDIITHDVDGFLVRKRNIEEFAEKVCQLIENQELRVRLGRSGIQSSKRYDVSFIIPRWKRLFEQLTINNVCFPLKNV